MRRTAALALAVLAAAGAGACRDSKSGSAASTTTTSTTGRAVSSTVVGDPAAKAVVPAVPDTGNSTNTTTVACLQVPAASTAKPPEGAPPLPAASRWFESTAQDGTQVAAAALPDTLEHFQTRVVRGWKADGWRELFGESEPGKEVEGVLQKGTTRVGVRARTVYCDKAWIEVRLSVAQATQG